MACSEDHGAIVDCEVLQGGCLKTGLREDLIFYYPPTFGGLIHKRPPCPPYWIIPP